MEKDNIVIGIEGLVGAGKTSICKELLNYIPNSIVIHAGDVYRAVTYKLMSIIKSKTAHNKENVDFKNINIKELIEKFDIKIKVENRETVVYFGDEKADINSIQSEENSLVVSEIASVANNKEAYKAVQEIIDKLKLKYNIIFSGRDTMKIYNNLDYHFFITADLNERVKRKSIQYNSEEKIIKEHIEKRDSLQKESGFYKIYDNTIVIDTTNCKNIKEATEKLTTYIKLEQVAKA